MRVLIRDRDRGTWRGTNGVWTSNLAEATAFVSLEAAGKVALGFEEQDLEVVLLYEEESCELALNPAYCVKPFSKPESVTLGQQV